MSAVREAGHLPEQLVVGYCNWEQCDDAVLQAVKDGVNTIIWFSVNLIEDENGSPVVQGGPDYACVAAMVKEIRELGLDCTHLISIGGWNSPHPATGNSAEVVFGALNKWNRETIAIPALGFQGFDGFDWDVEGNDDFDSKYNTFTVECVDLMGRISQLAKEHNYIVAMAPAESYLDPGTSEFSLSLGFNHEEWEELAPGFNYRGRNIYAALLAKYGKSVVNSESVDTFDFITIQLYEGHSHAKYKIDEMGESVSKTLLDLAQSLQSGWQVNFESVPALDIPNQKIQIHNTKLVIGLANGWAGDHKFLLIYPEDIEIAHKSLVENGVRPRGYAYWNMKDENIASAKRPEQNVNMAKGLNVVLHTRP